MCPCAPLVISAETHLQSLLCLGPCIYHDFGQYNAFAFQLMRCSRILADAILSIIFVQSAEIRWPDVIGHLYTSGLAMLSEILTEWVGLHPRIRFRDDGVIHLQILSWLTESSSMKSKPYSTAIYLGGNFNISSSGKAIATNTTAGNLPQTSTLLYW